LAYSPLEIRTVPLRDPRLDLENYRTGRHVSQGDAISDLFDPKRKTMQVATSILLNGYVDNEMPLVLPQDNVYVVLEGNERVAALKALHDPSLVPSRKPQLDELLLRHAVEIENLPTSIRVQLVPSRDFAIPHIARLHTGQAKDAWDLDSQARFVMDQLDQPGMTIPILEELIPDVKVARFVMMAETRKLLQNTSFADQILRLFAIGSELTLSSLEYAYKRKDVRDVLGIQFNKQRYLTSVPQTIKQKKALERLIWWFRDRNLNTRSPQLRNGTPENQEFIADLRGAPLPQQATSRPAGNDVSGSSFEASYKASAPNADTEDDPDRPSDGQPLAPQPSTRSKTRGPNRQSTQAHLDISGIYDEGVLTGNFKNRSVEVRSIDANSGRFVAGFRVSGNATPLSV
jgi:hypothetical protein